MAAGCSCSPSCSPSSSLKKMTHTHTQRHRQGVSFPRHIPTLASAVCEGRSPALRTSLSKRRVLLFGSRLYRGREAESRARLARLARLGSLFVFLPLISFHLPVSERSHLAEACRCQSPQLPGFARSSPLRGRDMDSGWTLFVCCAAQRPRPLLRIIRSLPWRGLAVAWASLLFSVPCVAAGSLNQLLLFSGILGLNVRQLSDALSPFRLALRLAVDPRRLIQWKIQLKAKYTKQRAIGQHSENLRSAQLRSVRRRTKSWRSELRPRGPARGQKCAAGCLGSGAAEPLLSCCQTRIGPHLRKGTLCSVWLPAHMQASRHVGVMNVASSAAFHHLSESVHDH